jgi:hypothetical protein
MPNENTKLKFGQVHGSLLPITYHFSHSGPANGLYDIALEAGEAALILAVVTKLVSGTCTIELRINNVAVVYPGSATTIAVTSAKLTTAAVSSRQIGLGSHLQLIVSGGVSPVNLAITAHTTRNA